MRTRAAAATSERGAEYEADTAATAPEMGIGKAERCVTAGVSLRRKTPTYNLLAVVVTELELTNEQVRP